MNISVNERNGVTVVAVEGSIDALTADEFLQALQGELAEGDVNLVADLSGVDYASSAGLRALLAGVKESRQKGGDLRLSGVQPGVQKVLAMSGFTSILKRYDDADAAVASF